MKNLIALFRKDKPKQKRTLANVFPPKHLEEIMQKSIDSKRTSIEEMQPSQRLFHSEMVIPKALPKDPHELFFDADVHPKTKPLNTNSGPALENAKPNIIKARPTTVHVALEHNNEPNKEPAHLSVAKTLPSPITDVEKTTTSPVVSFQEQKLSIDNATYPESEWIDGDTALTINGFKLSSGFFYYGSGSEQININPELTISNLVAFDDNEVDFTPTTYSELSDVRRSDYLTWLSGNRKHENKKMWCIKLYCYGIEHKLMYEYHKEETDQKVILPIYKELSRINQLEITDSTFKAKLANLLWVVLNIRQQKADNLANYSARPSNYKDIIWANKYIYISMGLCAANLLKWYDFNSEKHDYVQLKCTSDTGLLLLGKTYKSMYKSELQIKTSDTPLYVDYFPMSPLLSEQSIKSSIFDNTYDPILFEKTSKLMARCNAIYTQALTQHPGKDENLSLLDILDDDSLYTQQISSITKSLEGKNLAQINIPSLYHHLTKKEFNNNVHNENISLLNKLLNKKGLYLIPDHTFSPPVNLLKLGVIYKNNQQVVDPNDPIIGGIFDAIKIATFVTRNHKTLSYESKTYILNKCIKELLGENSQPSLPAHFQAIIMWQLDNLIKKSECVQLIEKIDDKYLSFAQHITFSLYSNAKEFSKLNESNLISFYELCGLSKSEINCLIIKIKNKIVPEKPVISFSLDLDTINQIQSDTNSAHQKLNDIFTSESENTVSKKDPAEVSNEASESTQDTPQYGGLDKKHSALFKTLTTKQTWTEDELSSVCQSLDILPSGAIETINDWSFDIINTTLIENDLSIDQELLQELLGEIHD